MADNTNTLDLERTIRDLTERLNALAPSRGETPGIAERLRDALDAYRTHRVFRVGQLVRWKPGLRDRKHPPEDQPAIVVEVLETPVTDTSTDASSPYFKNIYDLRCGVLVDGGFYIYYMESARLQPA
jgi:hypothetical protein